MAEVMTEAGQSQRWGRDVESITVDQHACRAYRNRPRSLAELLTDSLRWGERPFLVEGQRRCSASTASNGCSRSGRPNAWAPSPHSAMPGGATRKRLTQWIW